MDRDGRLFGKISIVDVIVLLVVAAMVAAVYVKTHKPQTGSNVGTTTVCLLYTSPSPRDA